MGRSSRRPHSDHDPSYNAVLTWSSCFKANIIIDAVTPEPHEVIIGLSSSIPALEKIDCNSVSGFSRL
jgi:hypothetical protein